MAGHLPGPAPLALARPVSTLSAAAGPPQGSALPAAPALIRLQLRISTILAASGESPPDFDVQIEPRILTWSAALRMLGWSIGKSVFAQ